MFCSKCGKELPEETKFCPFCGQQNVAAVNQAKAESAPTVSPVPENVPEKKGNKAKMVGIAATALIVVVAALLVRTLFFSGYKESLRDIEGLVNDRENEFDEYVDALAPDFLEDDVDDLMDLMKDSAKDEYDEMMKSFKNSVKEAYDELEEEYGSDAKLSFDVKDEKKLDKDKLEDIKDNYTSLAGYASMLTSYADKITDADSKKVLKIVKNIQNDLEDIKISKGYQVEVEVTIKGKKGKDTNTFTVNVIKVNGDWMPDYGTLIMETGSSMFNSLF